MRRISLAAVIGVLAASGAYVLIYLFRWEWHRAIITALFFVAAEIGFGLAVLVRRLSRLEQRIDELAQSSQAPASPTIDPAILERIRETAPPMSNPFAWLDPSDPRLGVFLPFLLGVGALASGLAWVVEQLARHTTTPMLERRLAQRLGPLALPEGGLLGIGTGPIGPVARPRLGRTWAIPIVALRLAVGAAAAGVDWLGDALQTRPDERRGDVTARVELQLRGSRSAARPTQAAAILWGTCSHVLHGSVGQAVVRDRGAGRIELMVPADIGEHAEERLRGCLQDAVVDRVQATVVSVEAVPAG
jgi:hypothetical protein